jgi:hypothetical protein
MFTDVATSRPLWGDPGYPVVTFPQDDYNNWLLIQ